MNLDKVKNMAPAHGDFCHVTGLPIHRKPEWTDIIFDTNTDYKTTLSIVGDSIVLAPTSGYATLSGVRNAVKFQSRFEAEAFGGERLYVQINDWSALRGSSFAARKYFVQHLEKNKQILGMIFYGVSPLFKVSIKLAMRLSAAKFRVQIVNDYSGAVKLALEILSSENAAETDNAPANVTPKPLVASEKEEDHCPVTGLTITTRPEWTDMDLGEGYSVTFKFIGDRILFSTPKGKSGEHEMKNFMRERAKVRDAMLKPDEPFFELKDYSGVGGRITKGGRDQFAKGMAADKDRIIGFIGYNAPVPVKFAINVGKRLHKSPFPMSAAKDYETAVKNAVESLESCGYSKEAPFHKKVVTRDDWHLLSDEFSARFEIINGNILHADVSGFLEEEHIEAVFNMQDEVIKAMDTPEGSFYFVSGVKQLRGSSWRARKLYANHLKRWHKSHPFRVGILYGANGLVSAAFNLAKPFLPFMVRKVNDLDDAMKLIAEDSALSTKHPELQTISDRVIQPPASDHTRQYIDDLLRFIGNVNWEFDEVNYDIKTDPSHPFNPVFDAIALIKNDLDELFQERTRAEEALRESEEKYRTILENIEDGYFEVDLTGNLTFFNDALCRITGYPKDKLMGVNNREYMDEETGRKVYEAYMKIFETGEPVKGLEYTIIKDSDKIHVETSVSLMRDREGRPTGFRGILRDVSKRKQAEEKIKQYSENLEEMVEQRTEDLKKSEEKYRTILENIEDGYYEVDLAGNLTFFNDAVCRITGYPEDELMGMNNREYTEEANALKLYREYNKVYETGMPTQRLDWEMIKRGGTRRFLESSISLIAGSGDQPVGFRGIIRDVTERKELDREIMEKRNQAEEATKAKSQFLANMSHEIRTPLNGIVGMAELALDTTLDDNQKNIFHTINNEANSLQDVINEILDFSKIEAGKFDLEEIPFDLRVTIEDMAASFAYRAEQKGLDFISFLAPDVPSRLIGDPVRLRQIMVNLIGNALKFTREGALYVKGELVEKNEDRVKIRFSVKDTGIGIPDARHATIFESFTQADGSTTRNYGGTGLGTTISKQLAEMMGGEIGLESEEGKGSTFWFTALFDEQEEKKQTPAAIDLDFSNLKVLIVDDNQTNRFVLMEYLKSWDCLPVEAVDGKEALIVFRDAVSSKNPFDLILTDFQMPEMSGFDLAKEIKKIESLKGVPIIVLTSAGRKGDGRNCKEIGINGYLTKPIRQDELRKAIVSVLGPSTGQETGSRSGLVTRHSIAEDYRKDVHILLVEDYPTNQQVAMRHLIKSGYQVDLAEDGSQAVKAYKRKNYNLIFMDIQMPIMDGYAATQEIREIEARNLEQSTIQRVPIIAMTAHAIKGYREKCLQMGMDDYIAKPLRRKELLTIAEKWSTAIADCGLRIADSKPEVQNPKSELGNDPIDFARAIEEFEGDGEFLMEVLEGFIGNVTSQIKRIRQAISDGDAEAVRREAHSIKGGAANLTANDLSGIAFELENIGRSGMLEEGIDALQKLEREFFRLERFVAKRET